MLIRVTYVTAKAFAQWVKKITPESFRSGLTFDPDNITSVIKYLNQACKDLEYNECKEQFVSEYLHGIREKSDEQIDYEIQAYTEMAMDHYLGTRSVSEAFKKIYKEYGDNIMSINIDPASIEELPLLSILIDYITAKYKCVDYSVETIETMARFTFMTEKYDPMKTRVEEIWGQASTIFNLRPATKITELVFTFGNLALIYPLVDKLYYLLCYFESANTEHVNAVILTHNSEYPTLVIKVEKFTPSGRILYGQGALIE